jgi:hypothetical protein
MKTYVYLLQYLFLIFWNNNIRVVVETRTQIFISNSSICFENPSVCEIMWKKRTKGIVAFPLMCKMYENIFEDLDIKSWAGHVSRMGEGRGVYRVLVGKPEGKRPLGRPSCRWEDNVKTVVQEVGCGGMD